MTYMSFFYLLLKQNSILIQLGSYFKYLNTYWMDWMTFCTDIKSPQRMNCNDFGFP